MPEQSEHPWLETEQGRPGSSWYSFKEHWYDRWEEEENCWEYHQYSRHGQYSWMGDTVPEYGSK